MGVLHWRHLHRAWTAVTTGVFARLAAALSTVQLALFGLIVWLLRVLAGAVNEFQWGEFVVTFALAAGGWVAADSYRGMLWLAVGKR